MINKSFRRDDGFCWLCSRYIVLSLLIVWISLCVVVCACVCVKSESQHFHEIPFWTSEMVRIEMWVVSWYCFYFFFFTVCHIMFSNNSMHTHAHSNRSSIYLKSWSFMQNATVTLSCKHESMPLCNANWLCLRLTVAFHSLKTIVFATWCFFWLQHSKTTAQLGEK